MAIYKLLNCEIILIALGGLMFIQIPESNGQIQLPPLGIDRARISVSGISSGAIMATQYHFAHSSELLGAGIFAGVPYMCGHNGLAAATLCMSSPAAINVPALINEASKLENLGEIDSTSNIRDTKVYIFHGSKDSIVKPAAGPKIQTMYQHYGADIKTEFEIAAEHGQPSHNYGAVCDQDSKHFGFINNCSYNGAFEMLNHIYGGILQRPDEAVPLNGDLSTFDQAEFFNFAPSLSSMDTTGFIYIPSGCKNGEKSCSLHIAYHGCHQQRGLIGDTFPTKTGYLEVAELNDIVVLFPQTISTLSNPNGCWDWWGYLNIYYPTKMGNQILATYRMMTRLMSSG